MWLCRFLPERRLRPLAQVRGSCPCRVRRLCELECPCRRWCHWSRQFLLCISDYRFSSEKNCAEFSLFSKLEQLFKDGGCSSPSCTHSSSIVLCFLRSLTDAPVSLPSLFDCRPYVAPCCDHVTRVAPFAAAFPFFCRLSDCRSCLLLSLTVGPMSLSVAAMSRCGAVAVPLLIGKKLNHKICPFAAAFPLFFRGSPLLFSVVYPWRCCDAVAPPSDPCGTKIVEK